MGLLKTGLKAVVAVKTADVIHQRILDRQAAQWGPYGPAPAPGVQPEAGPGAAPASSSAGVIDQLERLGQLRASGVLTDAEFQTQKARILAGY
jgi:hypothetical protein